MIEEVQLVDIIPDKDKRRPSHQGLPVQAQPDLEKGVAPEQREGGPQEGGPFAAP